MYDVNWKETESLLRFILQQDVLMRGTTEYTDAEEESTAIDVTFEEVPIEP